MALQAIFWNVRNNYSKIEYLYQNVRTLKSNLNIKWIRPEKISCIKPEKSGDLKPREPLDLNQFATYFQNSKELQTANEVVKRRFSLRFNPRCEGVKASLQNVINSVKRHKLDTNSAEAMIAGMTVTIRQLQEHMEKHPKDKVQKVVLKELIEKRRRRLRILRRSDYKRFEWLLEKLDIVYKPQPDLTERVERKKSLRRLTDLHCEQIKEERLSEYQSILQSQQEEFLLAKAEKYKWILDMEKKLEVEPSVTEKDIEEINEMINKLKLSQRKSDS